MLAYSAGFFTNYGNFHSFGDSKFVPELSPEDFKTIARTSESYSMHKEVMDMILEKTERELYTEDEPFKMLGFRDENKGTTSYYSSNISKDEAKMVDEWCQTLKISPLNTRLLKLKDDEYELRISSMVHDTAKMDYLKTYEKGDKKLHVKAGDFSDHMSRCVTALQNAGQYAGNDH